MRVVFVFFILAILVISAQAAPVEPESGDGVASVLFSESNLYVLTTIGQVWHLGFNASEWGLWGSTLPVALSEIADWELYFLVTHSGDVWRWDGGQWGIIPPLPDGAVPAVGESLSDLKNLYR